MVEENKEDWRSQLKLDCEDKGGREERNVDEEEDVSMGFLRSIHTVIA